MDDHSLGAEGGWPLDDSQSESRAISHSLEVDSSPFKSPDESEAQMDTLHVAL